ncbi:MAG: aldo/keto reductase [Lysobacterales bacterium]
MEYRHLGKSGLKVSSVGLGCNNFGMVINRQQTTEVVSAALDQGITLFDTADVYGNGESEQFLGKALGDNRSRAVIATKFGNSVGGDEHAGGASRRYILSAVESSLKRLNTDYIDLYQLHTPDPYTPLDETLRALDDLVRSGKVRYLGCSNFSSWQVVESQWISRQLGLERFVTAQNRYSLLSRRAEEDLLPACEHSNVSLLPFFPLESGLLTGKYTKGQEPQEGTRWHAWKDRGAFAESFFSNQRLSQVDRLQDLCHRFDHSLLELAFGWLLKNAVVGSVIAGATKPHQIVANVEAGLFRPSEEETSLINDISLAPISATAWGA